MRASCAASITSAATRFAGSASSRAGGPTAIASDTFPALYPCCARYMQVGVLLVRDTPTSTTSASPSVSSPSPSSCSSANSIACTRRSYASSTSCSRPTSEIGSTPEASARKRTNGPVRSHSASPRRLHSAPICRLAAGSTTACVTIPGDAATSPRADSSLRGESRKLRHFSQSAPAGNCVRNAVSMCRGRFPVESERTYTSRGPDSFFDRGRGRASRPRRAGEVLRRAALRSRGTDRAPGVEVLFPLDQQAVNVELRDLPPLPRTDQEQLGMDAVDLVLDAAQLGGDRATETAAARVVTVLVGVHQQRPGAEPAGIPAEPVTGHELAEAPRVV